MKITITTPTFNREHTLPNLYKSLIKNKETFKNFEWLIMDDGSTDNTEDLIKSYIKEKKIDIKYFKQENAGKMAALNNLNKHIKGDLTIECDSDDYFVGDFFKTVNEKYSEIKNNKKIVGMMFLKTYTNNENIGTYLKEDRPYKIFDMYNIHNVEGDKCIVFKSDVRKKFYHKLEKNEKFITEGRLYNEIDLKYDGYKCYNINAIVCEYLSDGYTSNLNSTFKAYPLGYYKYYKEMFDHSFKGMSLKKRLHILKHYILFSKLTNKNKKKVIKNTKGFINKLLVTILVIPGYLKTKKVFKQKKILFISSTGGHLNEMLKLSKLFDKYNYHIITDLDKTTFCLKEKYGKKIDYLKYGTKDHILKYLYIYPYNVLKTLVLFFKIKPDIIITTGAHTGVFSCYLGKILRKKVIFIESFANSESKTLSGRLVYPIADLFVVQWEEMLKLYPKATYGGWIY